MEHFVVVGTAWGVNRISSLRQVIILMYHEWRRWSGSYRFAVRVTLRRRWRGLAEDALYLQISEIGLIKTINTRRNLIQVPAPPP